MATKKTQTKRKVQPTAQKDQGQQKVAPVEMPRPRRRPLENG